MINELADLKAEGRVLIALITGLWGLDAYQKTFATLKRATGLSAPWLAKTLRRLVVIGYVEHNDRFYRAKPQLVEKVGHLLEPFYGGYLVENTRRIVDRLRTRHPQVEAAILFGSVARGDSGYDSDVDLLIPLQPYDRDLSFQVYKFVSDSSLAHEVPIEPIPIAADDLRLIVKRELQFLFGILEGYIVLYDRRDWAELLQRKKEKIEERYKYIKEVPMWALGRGDRRLHPNGRGATDQRKPCVESQIRKQVRRLHLLFGRCGRKRRECVNPVFGWKDPKNPRRCHGSEKNHVDIQA